MKENEKVFIDTNMLVYAYDKNAGSKHRICRDLISNCFSGKTDFYISNQILAEFGFVALNKIENKLSIKEVKEIVQEINLCNSWHKIDYSTKTVEKMLSVASSDYFWDSLIAETMKENEVFSIYTENERDFKTFQWLKVINPLK